MRHIVGIEHIGHRVDRIGNARQLTERLVKGDRWDLVFNICEGLRGLGREAQVPAILDLAPPLPGTARLIELGRLILAWRNRLPKVVLDITLSDRVVDLVEEGYDVAVRIAQLPSSNLVSRRLAGTRIVLCASPGYLAAHGAPVHPRELGAHRTIGYSYWAGGRNEWVFDGPDGKVAARVDPVLHANNGDTCRAAALDDQGIILQPDFIVGDDLRSGALVEVMPEFRAIELGIHAVYPTRKHLPLKVRVLVDFLVEAFAEPAWARP